MATDQNRFETGASNPARVLIVGTYHFANPDLDIVQIKVADVLTEIKQAEIQSVTDYLP